MSSPIINPPYRTDDYHNSAFCPKCGWVGTLGGTGGSHAVAVCISCCNRHIKKTGEYRDDTEEQQCIVVADPEITVEQLKNLSQGERLLRYHLIT